jgi:TolB-like protein/Tfp pilus assembly protein PilF
VEGRNESKEQAVRAALDRILSSKGFSRNDRQSQFLRFLVERHLDGRDNELKESVIGVEVFGRDPAYDPKLDAVVRTEAVRLRARLDKYYAAEGASDPLIIDLPKGGYKPAFRDRVPAQVRAALRSTRIWWIAAAVATAVIVALTLWWRAQTRDASFSVAVLPFENLNRDPDTDYFVDGLTDEIIRNLSIIEGLTVPSRTSSFALRGKSLNAHEAGKQLGADYLIEGSVQHAGDQLRVNAALIRVRDDSRLWSERFERKLTDVFAIQDEISRGIVNTLRLKLSPGRRQYETNLGAYDDYLRARQLMASFPTQGRPIAVPAMEYFERAIAKDPHYALAYAGLADAYLAVERNVGAQSPIGRVGVPRARETAARAVELDPMLSEAHSAMASLRAREYAWHDAEQRYRRAIELNPNNALARLGLGYSVLLVQGRFEEGLNEIRRAVQLDPLSPYINTEYGRALVMAGRYDEATGQLRKAIALEPTRNRPYGELANVLSLQARHDEAFSVLDEAVKRGANQLLIKDPCIYARAGRRDEALALVRQRTVQIERVVARAYACLGQSDEVLDHLEKALEANEPNLPEIVQSPEMAPMHTNPRFAVVRKKLNLVAKVGNAKS